MWLMSRATALLAALVLAACAGCTTRSELRVTDEATPPTTRPSAPPLLSSADHNDPDLDYVREIGRLHPQAVRMAYAAEQKDVSPALLALAAEIRRHRFDEMTHVVDLAALWGAGYFGSREGRIPGELTNRQLRELEALDGRAFERRWVALMEENRRAAAALSVAEMQEGRNTAARQLAQRFVSTFSPAERTALALLRVSRGR